MYEKLDLNIVTDYDCINSRIVNMMRTTILLCFMTIIFALMGFFLEIIGPMHVFYRCLRRYAILGTCTGKFNIQ